MTPRTKKQFETIREDKKSLIMDVALELFGSEGYYTTSISDIAQAAGISKGLMYNYFDSKDDLIREIVHNGLDKIDQLIDPNSDGVLTREEMRFFIITFLNLMVEEEHFWKLYFSLFLQPPVLALVEEKLAKMMTNYLKMLTNYFSSQGYEDPETESILFGAMLDGIGFNFISNTTIFPVERIKDKLIKMYCK